jgi:hypothetical protein
LQSCPRLFLCAGNQNYQETDNYQIIPAAGHHAPENGYQLMIEEPDKLVEVLTHENPEIVISSIRGSCHLP